MRIRDVRAIASSPGRNSGTPKITMQPGTGGIGKDLIQDQLIDHPAR